MNHTIVATALIVALCGGMLGLLEYGRRLGKKRLDRDPESARAGVAAMDGTVFALLGLLIAFTFSSAAARFQVRRELITNETNAIGTAWLRLALLPTEAQPAARENMRKYVEARLAVYAAIPDREMMQAELQRVSAAQNELWRIVIDARGGKSQGWEIVVLPALNEMFDISTTRTHAIRWHPPLIVFLLLTVLALGCSLLAGFAMSAATYRPLIHMLAFSCVVALTVYVIVDFEFPRYGLIRVDDDDQALIDLRASMD